jgi:hypothetical protein
MLYFIILILLYYTCIYIVLHCDLHYIYFMLRDRFYIHVYGLMEGTIKLMEIKE